jgi:uncharacterized repeat protein (TIGR02543 family)
MRRFLCMAAGAFLASCLGSTVVKAQQPDPLPPPIVSSPLQYSSPYGPRNKVSTQQYQFHKGVDYAYGLGTPIHAVQGGTITTIDLDGQSNWFIRIDGGGNGFAYLHLFDDSWLGVTNHPQDNEGNFIFGQACLNSLLVGLTPVPLPCANKSDLVTLEATPCINNLAIVFWQDFAKNMASKVLSACVLFDNFSIGGKKPTKTVLQQDVIAVVGHSGSAAAGGPHLHLQVNSGAQNPLLYVLHDNSNPPGYTINSISKDKGTNIFDLDSSNFPLDASKVNVLNPRQDSPLIIRTEVDASNVGHDLDQVQIFMFKAFDTNVITSCKNGASLIKVDCFNYGGVSGGQRNVFFGYENLSDAVVGQGVYPQAHRGGVVDFLTNPLNPIDLTALDPGSYLISVSAVDVLGDTLQESPIEVAIPPKLTVTVVGDGNVFSTPAGLNSGTNFAFCGLGEICSDWFDITNGVSLTATPLPGSGTKFLGWTVDCSGTGETITVFTPSDTPKSMNCTATFKTVNFTGQWNSTYGAMFLTQNGAFVTGTYDVGGFNGSVSGTVTTGTNGDLTLSALWSDDTGTGSLTFHLSANGNSFLGSWLRFTGSGNPGGGWCGARIGTSAILPC